MRIAIDCSHHLIPGGIRTYIENLLPAMALCGPENEYLLYYRRLRRPDVALALPPGTKARTVFVRAPRRLLARIENTLGLPPVELSTGRVDVFHGIHLTLPPARRARLVLTVHDLAYLRNPDFFADRRWAEYHYRYLLGHALRRADLVLAISQATREDLIDLFRVDEARVWVLPSGVDERFRPVPEEGRREVLRRLGISRPYVLYPAGTVEPRKNLDRVLEAFAAAFPAPGERPLLVVTGSGPDLSRVIPAAARAGIGGDVAALNVRYPDELCALMSGAPWGMYLSLYEGFGLPPLECMACGLPLLTSQGSAIPEVVGEDALLVDPRDVGAIAAGMRRLHEDEALREDLRRRGLRRAGSEAFSWKRVALQNLAAYRMDRTAFDRAAGPAGAFLPTSPS